MLLYRSINRSIFIEKYELFLFYPTRFPFPLDTGPLDPLGDEFGVKGIRSLCRPYVLNTPPDQIQFLTDEIDMRPVARVLGLHDSLLLFRDAVAGVALAGPEPAAGMLEIELQ